MLPSSAAFPVSEAGSIYERYRRLVYCASGVIWQLLDSFALRCITT